MEHMDPIIPRPRKTADAGGRRHRAKRAVSEILTADGQISSRRGLELALIILRAHDKELAMDALSFLPDELLPADVALRLKALARPWEV